MKTETVQMFDAKKFRTLAKKYDRQQEKEWRDFDRRLARVERKLGIIKVK